MVAYWVDYGMSHVTSGAQWRFPISLQIFFALSTIALITFLPESPRWLLYHDRQDEAAEILIRLHSDEDAGTAGREMQEIIVATKGRETSCPRSRVSPSCSFHFPRCSRA
jgi:hypothetical protein